MDLFHISILERACRKLDTGFHRGQSRPIRFLMLFEPAGNSWRLPIDATGKMLDAHVVPHCAAAFSQTFAKASKRRAKSSFFFFFTEKSLLCRSLFSFQGENVVQFWVTILRHQARSRLCLRFWRSALGRHFSVFKEVRPKHLEQHELDMWYDFNTSHFKVNNTPKIMLFLVISGFFFKKNRFFLLLISFSRVKQSKLYSRIVFSAIFPPKCSAVYNDIIRLLTLSFSLFFTVHRGIFWPCSDSVQNSLSIFLFFLLFQSYMSDTTYTKQTNTLAEDYFRRKWTNKEQMIE